MDRRELAARLAEMVDNKELGGRWVYRVFEDGGRTLVATVNSREEAVLMTLDLEIEGQLSYWEEFWQAPTEEEARERALAIMEALRPVPGDNDNNEWPPPEVEKKQR
jgi:hypothetical protein